MNVEAREEVLARLLARSLELLGMSQEVLADTDGARVYAREADEFTDDCREFMASLVQKRWAPGEAPPGVESIQQELADREAEARRAARNKRKAGDRKAPNRRGGR